MKRMLGRSNIEVSTMGMGCWAIGGPFWAGDMPIGWGESDDAESEWALRTAVDLGVTFFDTSDAYGTGHSERLIGQTFQSMRDKVIIGTKFGNVINEPLKQLVGAKADATYIRQACEASLRRLQTDYIDLYQFHLSDYGIEKAEDVRETLEALVAEGKIRAYAWSTDDPKRAAIFAEGMNCTAVQHELNVINDYPEMIDLCEKENLASINRSPLAMGLLSGKYKRGEQLREDDIRGKHSPEWLTFFQEGQANPQMLTQLDAIRDILTSKGRTLVQGALAWIWGRSEQTIPIPGIRTVQQAKENCGAMEFGPLKPEQMAEITRLLRGNES